jgi:hypothetical protein
MTTLLELNDADLTLYRDGRPVYRAPGIAVIAEREILFGEPAQRLARIYPRQANQQYFSRMNADPLEHTAPRARNHADLVYLHLRQLAEFIDEEIVLAVPAVFSADQLGVLLGILQESGIRVAGFVDSAVAAAAALALPDQAWHLDVLLQRAVVTTIGSDGEVSRRGAEEVGDCGLARLIDGWIDVIADRFIRETRFDPLHSAATEQQLYNQVFDLVRRGSADRELAFELVQGEQTRRVEVGRSALEERGAQRFRRLADLLPPGAQVLVTPRTAALPGLLPALQEARLAATVLAGDALAQGCQEHLARIAPEGGELWLVTRLPARRASERLAEPPETLPALAEPSHEPHLPTGQESISPTHVLLGQRALPFGHPALPFAIVRHGPVALLRAAESVTLNGTAIFRDTALEAGDRIARHGIEYLVISVET